MHRSKLRQNVNKREIALETRNQRFLRMIVVGAVAAAIIGIGLSIFAFSQQREAQQERDTAQRQAEENQSLVWAFQARTLNQVNTPLALRLALESIRIEDPPLSHSVSHTKLQRMIPVRYLIREHIQRVQSVTVNSKGTRAVTGSCAVIEEDRCTVENSRLGFTDG